MKNKTKDSLLLVAVAIFLGSSANAATLVWDSGASAGIQAGSGTWDFNTAANWTTDGGVTRINWSDNSDTASFQLQGNTGVVSIGATQVGAAGLNFTGLVGSTSGTWTVGTLGGDSIQLGSGGIVSDISDGLLLINAPLVLTSSQTWSTTRVGTTNGTASVRANGPISTLSGTTNLTFDGRGLTNAVTTGNGLSRVVFSMGGANTYSGSTTVTGGAALRLDYVADSGGKLDDAGALIFAGGSISLNGPSSGANILEIVGSTVVALGANSIYNGPNGSGGTINKIQLGTITRNTGANSGGTLDISNAAAGIASTTTANTNGIIGGWATMGTTAWAVGSADGVTSTNITGTSGSTRSNSSLWGGSTENVNATNAASSTESGIGSKSINALRIANAGVTLSFDGASTLQLTSGGIIAASTDQSITGGKIVSGMATGELFVHTPNANTFIIGSEIADNGGIKGILVKAGASTLTLSGANSYTGGTYVNAGTLAVSSTGSLANGNVTVRGAATFILDSASAIKFNIDGSSAGQFDVFKQDTGGFFTLNGTMDLEFGSTFGSQTWDLFNLTSGSADGFTAINLVGAYSGFLTESGGIWTGAAGGQNFQFDEATGILTVVPEPGTVASLLMGGMALVAMRRKKPANLI